MKREQYFKLADKFDSEGEILRLYGYPAFVQKEGKIYAHQKGSVGAEETSILKNDFIQKKIWHHLPCGPGYSGGPILS